MMKEDTSVIFAKNAVATTYDDIPSDAVETTKKHILDILAVTIGGSTKPGCVQLVQLVKNWRGKREATVLGYGFKVPAHHAAWVNGAMANSLDLDDCDDRTGEHAGGGVISAAFAAAELTGQKVSGKDFICAVAVGLDMCYRMALAHKPKTDVFMDGWWNSQLYGYLAGPVTAGKIMGLSQDQTISAIGFGFQDAGGTIQWLYDGALSKIMIGSAARASITAALLAQQGLRGSQNTFEGPAGLFSTYLGSNIDYSILTKGLGKKFLGVETGFKAYPCCRLDHAFIDATLALRKEHKLKPDDIATVTVVHSTAAHMNVEPLDIKCNPRTLVDAQFSIPWTVAVALVYGKVLIKDFNPDALKDPAVLSLTKRISGQLDEGLNVPGVAVPPAMVKIKTRDGRALSKRVDHPLGSRQNPMGWEDFIAKLDDCASWAAKPPPKANLSRLVKTIRRLDEVDDVRSLIELVSPS